MLLQPNSMRLKEGNCSTNDLSQQKQVEKLFFHPYLKILSFSHVFNSIATGWMIIYVWTYFQAFCSIPLIYVILCQHCTVSVTIALCQRSKPGAKYLQLCSCLKLFCLYEVFLGFIQVLELFGLILGNISFALW